MRKVLVILVLLTSMGFVGCQAAEEATNAPTTTDRPTKLVQPVLIMDSECSHQGEYRQVSGKVWNASEVVIRGILMRATVYTDTDKIINTDTAYIDSDVLAPGASATFTVLVADPGDESGRYSVKVEDYRF